MATLNIHTENTARILFVSAIILMFSSFFMPLVLVFFIQDYLYLSNEKWFYVTPPSAYVIFMIGMLWISITLLVHLFIQRKYELKHYKWITILLMSISIPFFMFGISNYYYLDNEGLHFNDEKTFNTIISYDWEDIKEAKEVFIKSNGVTVMDHYRFITKDGDIIDLPYNSKVGNNKSRIVEKLKEHNVPVTNNMGDLYE
ncbi:hypothetical protein M3204_17345 [Mesobacillus subterraneus]|uniref:hypothetical protein n=1 Tax=Mesobacillus subterraneus TaxID=285983 RepID=UPI00203EE758|nr:hypothetical protein [Mesobacillus subterraneus]MCM3666187.1 hypothetical protein [Mesobacillus subterraneus]MCM3685185.1 hypothetical protein [Mesobacillus subterraneus]